MSRYNYAKVQNAVDAYVAARDGKFLATSAATAVAIALGGQGEFPDARLAGQVRRYLDSLSVPAGPLVKHTSRRAMYYTWPAWEAEQRERAVNAEARADVRRRWETVNSWLTTMGIYGTNLPHEAPRLSLATWEGLPASMQAHALAAFDRAVRAGQEVPGG